MSDKLTSYSPVVVAANQAATDFLARFLSLAVFPSIQAVRPSNAYGECLWAYFQRLLPLVRSIARLDQVSLFQLVVAANRSLLEILVDVIHLHYRVPEDAPDRIKAWEFSAKLKAAESVLRYRRSKEGDNEALAIMVAFVERYGPKIRELRSAFWPTKGGEGRHPDRWTGLNLGDDCRSADKLAHYGLEDFYETQYRQMNWSIHGSGFAATNGLEISNLEMLYGRALVMSGRFALLSTGMILTDLGLFHGSMQEDFRAAQKQWTSLMVEPLKEAGWPEAPNSTAPADQKAPLSGPLSS